MFEAHKRAVMSRRIEAGVRWLDGYFGREGWLSVIDTQKLKLSSGNTCMIGQLFQQERQTMRDNFTQMIRSGLMTGTQATARGFYLPNSSFFPWVPTSGLYTELTHLWVEKMGQLRQQEQTAKDAAAAEAKKPVLSPIQVQQ